MLSELLDLCDINVTTWCFIYHILYSKHILMEIGGLITFKHDQVPMHGTPCVCVTCVHAWMHNHIGITIIPLVLGPIGRDMFRGIHTYVTYCNFIHTYVYHVHATRDDEKLVILIVVSLNLLIDYILIVLFQDLLLRLAYCFTFEISP